MRTWHHNVLCRTSTPCYPPAHHEDQAARLSRFEFSRVKRKRNIKRNGNGEPVSNNEASTVELAIGEAVLAHVKPLLGQSGETG
jgi:hypothetical protein